MRMERIKSWIAVQKKPAIPFIAVQKMSNESTILESIDHKNSRAIP